jgi:hypothetical protein
VERFSPAKGREQAESDGGFLQELRSATARDVMPQLKTQSSDPRSGEDGPGGQMEAPDHPEKRP